ncbi:MAG TPA: phosphoribosylaminoimidazolesuccinocarboxamide synthase [Calditrichia bacterium]|nr:phosphoribosylaminoimidazolesuccinocarboxamide synthase [Calditrichota bacterium]HQV32887.1 phosphoribosylaminoimidazolesuccinocarboxamide synthase [Calditrichia bacterium]
MEMKELIGEGLNKKIYATNQSDQVIYAYNDKKKGDKTEVNTAVSGFLFEYLESYNVPTHFVKTIDSKSFAARKLELIPMSIQVHNIADEDLGNRFGLESGKVLEFPIVEMYFRKDGGEEHLINEYHAYALGLCDRKEMTSISRIATKVNAVLKSFFDRRKLRLVNFRLEFGRAGSQIYLADELSLDTMNVRLVDDKGEMQKADEDKKTLAEIKARITGD